VGLSVSRVGGNAQINAMRQVAGILRLNMAQYNELATFAQFSSELDKSSQAQLAQGERMAEVLKQDQYQPFSVERQIMIIWVGVNGFLEDIPVAKIREFEREFNNFNCEKYPDILKEISEKKNIDETLRERMKSAVLEFKKQFK
jgi:F-type H+-transporting ATPase subunit alpha